ncbi:hypothetical protein [Burkholderia cenocepacia]|uniref:hypothetical protein n=1 Tax=Burkholderia cenocepacia TaxID=95486 RepID=UPI000A40A733|nr:hypothetical protein [Burkholderia cenocepacia]
MIDFTKNTVTKTPKDSVFGLVAAELPLAGIGLLALYATVCVPLYILFGNEPTSTGLPLWANTLSFIALCVLFGAAALSGAYETMLMAVAMLFAPSVLGMMTNLLDADSRTASYAVQTLQSGLRYVSVASLCLMTLSVCSQKAPSEAARSEAGQDRG